MSRHPRHRPAPPPPAVLCARDAATYLGISQATLRHYAAAGTLPRPIQITPRRLVWLIAALDAHLAGAAGGLQDSPGQSDGDAAAAEWDRALGGA